MPPIANDDALSGDRDVTGNVGYYEMGTGQGANSQIASITAGGHTAVNILNLSAAELAGIDVLVIQNPSNGNYSSEFRTQLPVIHQAVEDGLVLVIHDRYVETAENILPGSEGFDIRRVTGNRDIELLDDAHPIADGVGGVVSDTSLDNGNSSSHGYAVAGSLPGTADLILSMANTGNIVTFAYEYGAGDVIYSSIPLDYYLASNSTSAVNLGMRAYAANLIDYAANVLAEKLFTNEDTPALIDVADLLANDSDPDGGTLAVSGVAATSTLGAALTLNLDGTITYDPTGSATLDALSQGDRVEDS
ncbi:cadherin-like domain-containing protein, partial [Mesobacterium pallidum]|uniref:cadherin-like domain-containing protein n=1 Tax=Mesobacterium pallidum TaxID=2872037 RepID=UPI001EE31CFD